MAASYNKFNLTVDDLVKAIHNFSTATFNIALFNTAPVATNHVFADLSGEATGGGYVSGGSSSAMSVANASGTETITATAVTFTAVSTSMGPFRYVVCFNNTAASKNLVAWWDFGSAVTLAAGESFTFQPNSSATTGTLFTLA